MDKTIGPPERYPLIPPSSMLNTVVRKLRREPANSKPKHLCKEPAATLNLGGAGGIICIALGLFFVHLRSRIALHPFGLQSFVGVRIILWVGLFYFPSTVEQHFSNGRLISPRPHNGEQQKHEHARRAWIWANAQQIEKQPDKRKCQRHYSHICFL